LKSIRHSPWNKYDGLPDDYKKICLIDHVPTAYKNALYFHRVNSQFFKGMHVIIRLKIKPDQLELITSYDYKTKPLIVSNLFKHERKVSVNHATIQLHNENTEDILKSKHVYEIHCGFRKTRNNIMISRIYNNCEKFKTVKKLGEEYEQTFLASFYGQIMFPPNN